MRQDMDRAIDKLPPKLQRHCRKSRNLERLSSYLRPDETVEFVAISFSTSGILAITTQRLLFAGNDFVNIPLSDIYSADVTYDPTTNNIFANSGQDVLKISMRGGSETFRLEGGKTAHAAREVLQATLMR